MKYKIVLTFEVVTLPTDDIVSFQKVLTEEIKNTVMRNVWLMALIARVFVSEVKELE